VKARARNRRGAFTVSYQKPGQLGQTATAAPSRSRSDCQRLFPPPYRSRMMNRSPPHHPPAAPRASAFHRAARQRRPFRADAARPNILWITSEAHGPHMGVARRATALSRRRRMCAAPPSRKRRDALSTARLWSNAPVCAPADGTIHQPGMYPDSLGAAHMRSMCPPFLAGKNDVLPATSSARRAGATARTTQGGRQHREAGAGCGESSRTRTGKTARRPAGLRGVQSLKRPLRVHIRSARRRADKQFHGPAKVPRPPYPPGHAGGAAGLSASIYDHVTGPQPTRGTILLLAGAGKDGLQRGHDFLLLRRPRLGHAAQQALACTTPRPARASSCLQSREFARCFRRNTRRAGSGPCS